MIFDRLSIFGWDRAVQLLKEVAAPASDCALCGGHSGSRLVCAPCALSLRRSSCTCPRCALPVPTPELCGRCLREPPAFDAALAAFEYRFPLDRLVWRFKFAGDLAMGRWLGEQLAAASASYDERPDVLVAPPLTRARLRSRGFNQAMELARVVGGAHRLPVEVRAVERVRETSPQPGLGGAQRRANLRNALRTSRTWSGASVAIVDDVMTTGATAEAMASVLKAGGARRVCVWVVARTPEPGR